MTESLLSHYRRHDSHGYALCGDFGLWILHCAPERGLVTPFCPRHVDNRHATVFGFLETGDSLFSISYDGTETQHYLPTIRYA